MLAWKKTLFSKNWPLLRSIWNCYLSAWTTSQRARPVSLSSPWPPRPPSPTWCSLDIHIFVYSEESDDNTWPSLWCRGRLDLHAGSSCLNLPALWLWPMRLSIQWICIVHELQNRHVKICQIKLKLAFYSIIKLFHLPDFEGCSHSSGPIHPFLRERWWLASTNINGPFVIWIVVHINSKWFIKLTIFLRTIHVYFSVPG